MRCREVESQYETLLAFSYGNTERLIKSLTKSRSLYNSSKNRNHPKAQYRIELYTKIIERAQKQSNN